MREASDSRRLQHRVIDFDEYSTASIDRDKHSALAALPHNRAIQVSERPSVDPNEATLRETRLGSPTRLRFGASVHSAQIP